MTRIRWKTGLWVATAAVVFMACEDTPTPGDALTGSPLAVQGEKKLSLDLCAPSAGGFTTVSTNPYFPFAPGDQWFYAGDGETLLITVLHQTRLIDNVTTRVIEERETENGELLEISWNYFVQAGDGTVCYYGEDVDIYEENGDIVHDGAWCAEDQGNAAGIIMPADPEPGMTYQNELAPGIAEDQAKIVGIGPVNVPAGPFPETIRVRESSPLDSGHGFKVFAAGTGLIIDASAELVSFTTGASTPGPPTITLQTCGT